MDWTQPSVIVSTASALVAVLALFVNIYISRKQREGNKEVAKWTLHTSQLRTAAETIDLMLEKLRRSSLSLLTYFEVRELNLSADLKSVKRILQPTLDDDRELDSMVGWAEVYVHKFSSGVDGVDRFRPIAEIAVMNITLDAEGEEKFDAVYEWLSRFVVSAVDQRAARVQLDESLQSVLKALRKRMK